MLNIVIYGLGSWLDGHLDWLRNRYHLVGGYDKDSKKQKKADEIGIPFFDEEKLKQMDYDAIMVTSPLVNEISAFIRDELEITVPVLNSMKEFDAYSKVIYSLDFEKKFGISRKKEPALKIVIYGLGSWIDKRFSWLKSNYYLAGGYDKDLSKEKKALELGIPFLGIAELKKMNYDAIMITSTFVDEISVYIRNELEITVPILDGNKYFKDYSKSDYSISYNKTREHDMVFFSEHHFPEYFIGRGSYMGYVKIRSTKDYDNNSAAHLVQIGRYTSIGENITILCDMNHDYGSVYQGVIRDFGDALADDWRMRLGQMDRSLSQKGMILIGNDVWIGNNVTLLPDIVIGDGAVVAAGSIVTKDIPPYAIYGGNPARLIRYRFPEDIREGLKKIAWWNLSRKELLDIKDDMQGDVASFVEKYRKDVKLLSGEEKNSLPDICRKNIPVFLAFIDICTMYPTYKHILTQFCDTFPNGEAALVLCYQKNVKEETDAIRELTDFLVELPYDSLFCTYGILEDEEEALISQVNYFVVGRDLKNIVRTSLASKYNVICLSGVNNPVFNKKWGGVI